MFKKSLILLPALACGLMSPLHADEEIKSDSPTIQSSDIKYSAGAVVPPEEVNKSATGTVTEIKTPEDFERLVTRNTQPLIIDFYADWCQPCKRMAPLFKKLAAEFEGKARFVKINTETPALEKIVNKFSIRSIPTFIFYKNGSIISRKSGTMTEAELRKQLAAIISE